jgi:hypothetical protein
MRVAHTMNICGMVARHERTPGDGAIARAPDAEAAARASKPGAASASRSKRCPPKALSMLAYLLKTSDLATLFRFVSADFFKVVPVGDLLSLGTQLRRHADDHAAFAASCTALYARLVAGELAVRVTGDKRSGGAPGEGGARAATAALDLFFFQIFASETWLLDYRAGAFAVPEGDSVTWSPQALWWSPSPAFRDGTRELYAGFYTGDAARFDAALATLGLSAAKKPLEDHFGLGDQRAVRFELKTFQGTFAAVFEACRRAGTSIPPEFAVLGIMLLTLYENLEQHGLVFDVRAAFDRAFAAASRATEGAR